MSKEKSMDRPTVYMNQAKMELLGEELGEFVASKYGISEDAGEYAVTLIFCDKIREDEYEDEQIPLIEELRGVHLIE